MTVTRGKLHEYLGMTLDFKSIPGTCSITQYDFIKKMHINLPSEFKGQYRNMPAPENLFKINQDAMLVTKELSNKYHEITARCLWLSQRGRLEM